MELIEITTKDTWQEFMKQNKQTSFLQSWQWAEFQKKLDRKIWRLDLDGQYVLVIKMNLPYKKSYLYVPRTAIKFNQACINLLNDLAKQENSLFIKIEPVKQTLLELNFNKVINLQPKMTIMLDLTKDQDDLLMAMHQKTRYNIRLAEKKGVIIRQGEEKDLDVFYKLLTQTYQRKNINTYTKEYFTKLLEVTGFSKIYLAEYQGQVICANLIIFYGDTVTYLHGGSSQEHKNLMAPYLLQWKVIVEAQKKEYKYYDFWGIDNKYPGVTKFKKGFGGFEVIYPGAFDYITNKPWYYLYKLVKRFK